MNTAAATRAAIDRVPWLRRALRAGLLNAAAVAAWLDIPADTDAVAAAVRRYGADLAPLEETAPSVTVRMRSGIGHGPDDDDTILGVLDGAISGKGDGLTGIVCTGEVDASLLAVCIERLAAGSIVVDAAGIIASAAVIIVPQRDGPAALRMVEEAVTGVYR